MMIVGAVVELKNMEKCLNPTHGLPQIPPRTLKSLKAICTPSIG